MQNLTVLWLDDQRDPQKYFTKKDEKGEGTLHDNLVFYANLRQKYNLSFVWVKTFKEFTNYIIQNGMPQFISFDHDLSKTSLPTDPKGLDCAQWLVDYCRENGIQMPMTYVHSANPKWRGVIRNILAGNKINEKKSVKNIYITEEQFKHILSNVLLSESVFVNGIKGSKANLTYQKGRDYSPGNISLADKLKTDKMDASNEQTYEVPLKGGLMSYNITSINGTEVMHYFKNYFKNQKTNIELKDKKGQKKSYELTMEENEFNEFLQQFLNKVGIVIQYYMNKLKRSGNNIEFSGISVYPVKSSSNFNVEMCKRISGLNIMGMKIQAIDENLFLKDLRNLEKDEDFINKNKEYYQSPLSPASTKNKPIEDYLDADVLRYQAISKIPVEKYIDRISELSENIVAQLYAYRASQKNGTKNSSRQILSIAEKYKEFYDLYKKCSNITYYNTAKKANSTIDLDTIAEVKKYTKNQQVEIRTNDVWKLISPILKGQISQVTGKKYDKIPLKSWKYVGFQIKKLSNPERMGLRNIYNKNTDEQFVQQELEKIKGTVFVIFDDNVSGGATLSDVCYQAKKAGIDYIIPITFGKMSEKWQLGTVPINKPNGGFDLS